MSRVRRELSVDASPETVFSLLTDLSALPKWSTITLATHDPIPSPLKKGDTSAVAFDVEYRLPGGFLGDLAEFIAHRRNEREVEHSMQNLKDLAEHRSG